MFQRIRLLGRSSAFMNKKDLTERDIFTKFITPAVRRVGWDEVPQIQSICARR
jgi:hypothetical protein